jgi:hypothetical protein
VAWLLAIGSLRADELSAQAEKLQADYSAALERLAQECQRQGLEAQAAQTRQTLGPRDPYKLFIPVLPKEVGPPKLPENAPLIVVQWHRHWWKLRQDYAAAAFDLARRAVRARPSLAYMLAIRAIRADPDNAAVRKLFGYQESGNLWCTAYEVQQLRDKVWHEKFGWLPKVHVRRYEQGERRHNGRWISAEADARVHGDIRSGWDIDTEHYRIRTNHSIEAAVQLGTKLEQLYRIWQQIFVRYYASEDQVIALFDGRAQHQANRPKLLQIAYFRDRGDYNRTLEPMMPNIGVSIGVYIEQTQTAYFFAGEDADERTLYHEATHQLFHQSRPVSSEVGRRANFWIVEGIAMFMESLREENGYYVLGGADDVRVYAARYRLVKDNFYVPLGEVSAYGMARVQADPKIAMLYSEMAGLTSFLIFYDEGRYRDALVAFLGGVYNGNGDPNLLSTLVGADYSQLDKQYREFIEAMPKGDDATGK